jgi:hypothetical protein
MKDVKETITMTNTGGPSVELSAADPRHPHRWCMSCEYCRYDDKGIRICTLTEDHKRIKDNNMTCDYWSLKEGVVAEDMYILEKLHEGTYAEQYLLERLREVTPMEPTKRENDRKIEGSKKTPGNALGIQEDNHRAAKSKNKNKNKK